MVIEFNRAFNWIHSTTSGNKKAPQLRGFLYVQWKRLS